MLVSVREVVALPSSALVPLGEGVFQKQCRSPRVGAPLLEAQLCLHWLTRHRCCLGNLHISFAKHFVAPDYFGML